MGWWTNVLHDFHPISKTLCLFSNLCLNYGSSKVYLFKMSTKGAENGVNHVAPMQPRGDLQGTWLMFDYCKCVFNWITMACHIYYLTYVRVDNCNLWHAIRGCWFSNSYVDLTCHNSRGSWLTMFKQFGMSIVWIVFAPLGDPSQPLAMKNRTRLFHWVQYMELHTNKLI
jgi:hypothetical protein